MDSQKSDKIKMNGIVPARKLKVVFTPLNLNSLPVSKNSSDSFEELMTKTYKGKFKQNWFCNRPLSPHNITRSSDVSIKDISSSKKNEKIIIQDILINSKSKEGINKNEPVENGNVVHENCDMDRKSINLNEKENYYAKETEVEAKEKSTLDILINFKSKERINKNKPFEDGNGGYENCGMARNSINLSQGEDNYDTKEKEVEEKERPTLEIVTHDSSGVEGNMQETSVNDFKIGNKENQIKDTKNTEDCNLSEEDGSSVIASTVIYDSDRDTEFVPSNDDTSDDENNNLLDEDTDSVVIPYISHKYKKATGNNSELKTTDTSTTSLCEKLHTKFKSSTKTLENKDSANKSSALEFQDQPLAVEVVSATQAKKRRDFCYYCERYVLNFARHIKRNHSTEHDVQKIFSIKPKSRERKILINSLRKKGNYLISNSLIKPVKRPNCRDTKLLPCTYCLGFYSSKHLWRHRKVCPQKPNNSKNKSHQCDAQTLLANSFRTDQQLWEKVFPRMRPDEISLTAKKDPLICAFGARYLRIHREVHLINVTSRKMRELSRLLMEVKKLDSTIVNLLHVLQPQYYDLLVSATKNVGKYNVEKESFQSITYAMNIGTSLKQCCDIALIDALKKKHLLPNISSAEIEANLKTMIELLKANWRFDISTENQTKCQENEKIKSKKSVRKLVPWTDAQKKVVRGYFKTHITHQKPPKKGECETLIQQNQALLHNKDWLKIKVFVQNIYTKKIKFK